MSADPTSYGRTREMPIFGTSAHALREELQSIGCHITDGARCTCAIGADAVNLIDALDAHISDLDAERAALCAEVRRLENSLALADHLWTAKQARLTRMDLRCEAARTALAEIARISGGPIRRVAQDALEKMETD